MSHTIVSPNSFHLNQCWLVNWTQQNKFNQHSSILIKEYAFENEMSSAKCQPSSSGPNMVLGIIDEASQDHRIPYYYLVMISRTQPITNFCIGSFVLRESFLSGRCLNVYIYAVLPIKEIKMSWFYDHLTHVRHNISKSAIVHDLFVVYLCMNARSHSTASVNLFLPWQ